MSKTLLDYIGLEVVVEKTIIDEREYLAFTSTGTKVYKVYDTLLQWEHINEAEAEEWGLSQEGGEGIMLGSYVSLYFLALTLKGI